MKYTYKTDKMKSSIFPELFAREIDVPDEFGAVLHVHKVNGLLHLICENGTHFHKLVKRDPQVMMNKGKHAKLLHTLKKKGLTPVGVAYYNTTQDNK